MTTKDTASFFENGTSQQFEYCFKLYPQALKLKAEKRCKKPQELIRLDEWYQQELPKLIKARGRDAHLVYDELVQTMKWKQSRGKFYPQLSYLVKVNTPRAVMQETKKAFRKLPNLEQAITALSNLKGVGTTMASALLAAAAPDSAPFMADECLMAIPEIEGIDYTTKEYLNFVQHIQTTMQRLNKQAGGETPQWSPHRVELALWAHYVANDLSPELLDEMPTAAESRDVKANGTSALDGGGGGDTTDVDDESQGAATLRVDNNTATESEPEHEAHSNHRAADGDSNFVSNDSNSQPPAAELSGVPLNDENNTQTTGTNSSDATPLASDSESNLEAPNNEAKLLSNTAAGVDGGLTTLQHAANNGIAAAAVVAAANGNGAIHALATDSLDSRDDVDDDDDDEDDDDAAEVEDDDSNSTNNTNTNTNNSIGKSLTPIVNDGGNTNDDSMETTTTTNTTLSSGAGQKRALHCEVAAAADEQQQKKLRSD